MYKIKLQKRDISIIREIYRFRFALSRHVKNLANFKSQRTTDRRLKMLIEENLIARKKMLYGVPFIYTVTKKGKHLINATPIDEQIRIDKVNHDILVLDCLFKLQKEYQFNISDIITERELHSKDVFSQWQHHPDFVFSNISSDGQTFAVELELTIKNKQRLEKNIQSNFSNYDFQVWVVPSTQGIILSNLKQFSEIYPNIIIKHLEDLLL